MKFAGNRQEGYGVKKMVIGALIAWTVLTALVLSSPKIIRSHSVREPAPDEGEDSISVVVAAYNEAPRIVNLIENIGAQDHPKIELIVVDDRSGDGMGEVVSHTVADDPRFQLMRIEGRPSGWQGRMHAQDAGVKRATGE